MKLRIVPARAGAQWVREGVRLFFRQPLAFAGLFFLFAALGGVLTMVPVLGNIVTLALVPTVTVLFMLASREAEAGRFPLPTALIAGLRQSPATNHWQPLLMLGVLYAAAVTAVVYLTSLMGERTLDELLTRHGGQITSELMNDPELQAAASASMRQFLITLLLYVPVSVLFWHAPALVHWHGVPIVKSLFFSAVGVLRNTRAYLIYAIGWMTIIMAAWLVLLVVASVMGNAGVALGGMFPFSLVIATMISASLWGTFRDCFSVDDEEIAPP